MEHVDAAFNTVCESQLSGNVDAYWSLIVPFPASTSPDSAVTISSARSTKHTLILADIRALVSSCARAYGSNHLRIYLRYSTVNVYGADYGVGN